MNTIILLFISFLKLEIIEGRLIEKDIKATTEPRTFNNPVIRHTRDLFDEDVLTELSREETEQSDDFINRKTRYFFKYNPVIQAQPVTRLTRGSKNVTSTKKNPQNNTVEKPKTVLIQKPIPKFDEFDDEDEFQMNIYKSPAKFIDTFEHEDEDFNLDDYDFDVNHDEFAGRGKPLLPRMKNKDFDQDQASTEVKTQIAPEIKVKSKILLPPITAVSSNKKQRHVRKEENKRYDEYYDDGASKDIKKYVDIGDENYESSEHAANRGVRSPWKLHKYADKLSEKSSTVMSDTLSIFPTFP